MKPQQMLYERLLRQRIAGEGLKGPSDVARWMGAVQAQDYPGAKWALGLRTEAGTDSEIEAAFAAGEVVRTHVMRPTWHFLAPEDVYWMQALTASRVKKTLGSQFRALELESALLRRCNALIVKSLRGGKQLTRAELGSALERAGIQAKGLRLTGIVMNSELEALICSGARRGKQFTYALVDERAPQQRDLASDEGLALLTERFFTSHGPATIKDFAWWSGLTVAESLRGLEMVGSRLVREEIGEQEYWMGPTTPAARLGRDAVHLLPNYDEYLSGHTDRSAIVDARYTPQLDARQNPLFNHPILSAGRVAGIWKRVIRPGSLAIQPKWLREPTRAETRQLELAGQRIAAFYALSLEAG